MMRTTLDLADDVLAAARERAQRERKSIGQIISELARQALVASTRASAPQASMVRESPAVYGLQPFPSRSTLVTNELINELRQDDAF